MRCTGRLKWCLPTNIRLNTSLGNIKFRGFLYSIWVLQTTERTFNESNSSFIKSKEKLYYLKEWDFDKDLKLVYFKNLKVKIIKVSGPNMHFNELALKNWSMNMHCNLQPHSFTLRPFWGEGRGVPCYTKIQTPPPSV